MRKVAAIIYVMVLSLTAMYAAVADGEQTASAASMNWYLADSTTGIPSGANYWMNRGSGDGGTDRSFATNDSYIWVSNEMSNAYLDMSGQWSVTLVMSAASGGSKAKIEIGYFSGSTFTPCGSLSNAGIKRGTNSKNVTTTSHVIPPGSYVAMRITASRKIFTLDLTGGGTSPSYVSSPTGAPDYPGTENINFTVFDYGADGINFGGLNPGKTDGAEDAQSSSNGAVRLDVASDTNVNVNVDIKGVDFSGPATYLLSSADVQYDDDPILDEGSETGKSQGTLTTSYLNWYSVSAHSTGQVQTYYWITVPSGQYAGSYTSTFSFQCTRQ